MMKNKTLSVRVILPVVMSVSIVACIISSMMLFSYLFSSYFKKDGSTDNHISTKSRK